MERDFRLVAAEWDLLAAIPHPLPENWPEVKAGVIGGVPVHHFPVVSGTESSFGPTVLRAALSSRTLSGHYYCGVDGPHVYVSIMAIGDDWWVMNTYDAVRVYGTSETCDYQSLVGFQELMHGGCFPCPPSAAVGMSETIEVAARVAMNDQTVPYMEVDHRKAGPEWLNTVDTTWGE